MQDYAEDDPELLAWQIKAIEQGIARADRGELIPHEEIVVWIESGPEQTLSGMNFKESAHSYL